jgi:hypothetical protein
MAVGLSDHYLSKAFSRNPEAQFVDLNEIDTIWPIAPAPGRKLKRVRNNQMSKGNIYCQQKFSKEFRQLKTGGLHPDVKGA